MRFIITTYELIRQSASSKINTSKDVNETSLYPTNIEKFYIRKLSTQVLRCANFLLKFFATPTFNIENRNQLKENGKSSTSVFSNIFFCMLQNWMFIKTFSVYFKNVFLSTLTNFKDPRQNGRTRITTNGKPTMHYRSTDNIYLVFTLSSSHLSLNNNNLALFARYMDLTVLPPLIL